MSIAAVGDPVALRSVAGALRREVEPVLVAGRALTGLLSGMSYAGPAAETFRGCVTHCAGTTPGIAGRLLELAAWLDGEADRAEVELMARRAAGLA